MKVQLPETKKGVAALGLNSMINLTCVNCKISKDVAMERISKWLHCDLNSLKLYALDSGLPKHLVKPALNFCKLNDVRIYSYQLAPTKAVLSMYDII
ncbi:hypothetical protein VPAG_00030 [Vibrio phage douglas 12A4]|uniref:hypothetical protein n=1 Tax=Vibrio phage douglas 12A4 TaxID=573171 RepID=UPI0002C0446C|nr:hypothetical protein VPAG_00030 [Vibrio phage douglas 12A4]AGG58066.1 hypothetical protein VPAG_00030 [Vibrio phage douglas 12A4]